MAARLRKAARSGEPVSYLFFLGLIAATFFV